MNNIQRLLKSQLQKQLSIGPDLVTLNVMTLQNVNYQQCFAEASSVLNVDMFQLQQAFKEIVMNELVNRQSQVQQEPNQEDKNFFIDQNQYWGTNNRVNDRLQFKILFEQTLNQVLFQNTAQQDMTCEELCQRVDLHLQNSNRKYFWSRVQQLIPFKSEKQLREYYQKSFQRAMYTEFNDEEDKKLIKNLLEKEPNKRASVLADEFLGVCKCKTYFKRSVVMFIINLKRK
ncbi:Hypothetical_protein [Hexamita inflata]|uniref:Hypothetical_protein n=1 Tax=Hexamita inflata TaxID=28002 RepID=A0AA86NWG5_9EUKA|nr:Hypothetical protein HINF_LOCUS14893 [Hexamita inflata]